jgi:hypothetical protein
MPAQNVHSQSIENPPKHFKNGHDPPKAQKELFFSQILAGPFLFLIV